MFSRLLGWRSQPVVEPETISGSTAFYEALPPHSIRVLKLKKSEYWKLTSPDPRAQEVHCEMSVTYLTGQKPFAALSYVWGDPSVKEKYMVCNGHQIPITYNLWAALRQIWETIPCERIWADAICINQDDIPERNQQVTMMGSIYSTAICVFIWLGDATEHCEEFFDLANEVRDEGESAAGQSIEVARRSKIDFSGALDFTKEILSRPWFRRVWTLQEIRLARRALVFCGSHRINYQLFTRAIDRFNDLSAINYGCTAWTLQAPMLAHISVKRTLFHLLTNTSDREASDPRDKFYALLSLLPEKSYDFMRADYSLTVEETFTWAARVCIELDRDLNFLVAAGLGRKQGKYVLPSWVPDWGTDESGSLQSLQCVYMKLGNVEKDVQLLSLRSERGEKLEKRSRKIGILGTGFGRLEIDEKNGSAFLTMYPDYAVKMFKSESNNTSRSLVLSNNDFFTFRKRINQHDLEGCKCIDRSHRVEYGYKDNSASPVKQHDWLWSPVVEDDQRGHIVHEIFTLRPGEGNEDHFQLHDRGGNYIHHLYSRNASAGGAVPVATKVQATYFLV